MSGALSARVEWPRCSLQARRIVVPVFRQRGKAARLSHGSAKRRSLVWLFVPSREHGWDRLDSQKAWVGKVHRNPKYRGEPSGSAKSLLQNRDRGRPLSLSNSLTRSGGHRSNRERYCPSARRLYSARDPLKYKTRRSWFPADSQPLLRHRDAAVLAHLNVPHLLLLPAGHFFLRAVPSPKPTLRCLGRRRGQRRWAHWLKDYRPPSRL